MSKNTVNNAAVTKESDNLINMDAVDSSDAVTANYKSEFKKFMDSRAPFHAPIGNFYKIIRTALSISKAEVLRNINAGKSSLERFERGFPTSLFDNVEREYANFLVTYVIDISSFDPSWHYVAMEITDTIGDLRKILERISRSFDTELDTDTEEPELLIDTFERLQMHEKVKASLNRVNLSLVMARMIAEAIQQATSDWLQTEEGKAY